MSTTIEHRVRRTAIAASLLCLVGVAGCNSGPSRVEAPFIDADAAGEQAMEMYDKDGDGFVAGAELDAAPGIKSAMTTIDKDKDGKVTAAEITQRVEAWQATNYGVMPVSCMVTLDGQPLGGAEIVFDPEPFLGEEIKAAVGETSPTGSAFATVPKEQRPTADTPSGLQLGLYRVRVSKKVNGKETLPPQFNTETTVGHEIAPDDPDIMRQRLPIALKTK